jgi:hypothetical protein
MCTYSSGVLINMMQFFHQHVYIVVMIYTYSASRHVPAPLCALLTKFLSSFAFDIPIDFENAVISLDFIH